MLSVSGFLAQVIVRASGVAMKITRKLVQSLYEERVHWREHSVRHAGAGVLSLAECLSKPEEVPNVTADH